jgi:hypothetical protein
VVAANECDSIWVPDFEAKQEEEGFEGVKTTVNEVACVMISFISLACIRTYCIPMNR